MLADNPVNSLLTVYHDMKPVFKFTQLVDVLYTYFQPGKKTGSTFEVDELSVYAAGIMNMG